MRKATALALALLCAPGARADPDQLGEQIDVEGHYLNQVGSSDAASAGSFTRQLIEDRPLLRPGELEELVPGLIVTQHSGAGKANQFFVRGFNLDHGTDFATTLDGIQINLPSHAHGQGYDDLNFVIPELIAHADYVKGPYSASKGDFASAGAIDLGYVDSLPQARLTAIAGSYGYYRALAAASRELASGTLLFALEAQHEDGPWLKPEDFHKYNAVLKYTKALPIGLLSVMAQGYAGEWNSTDQIPLRAVPSIGRFGAIDDSDGGLSHRFTLSANWDADALGGELRAVAYVAKYDLDLFSDFTFFLRDPVHGDQMEQSEDRWYEGGSARWRRTFGDLHLELGSEGRIDHVAPLGLFHTEGRVRLQTYSLDSVTQSSGSLYGAADYPLARWLRLMLGLRVTDYDFHVVANDPRNSGTDNDALLLPKANLIAGPWQKSELFLNFGEDYHSNDARGVTATVDARSGESIAPVKPLPKSLGAELGLRSELVPRTQLSLALWQLDFDSELVWDADAGTTEPSARTRRRGVELSARFHPLPKLLFDLDAAWSRARFRDFDPAGQYVPEAIETSLSAGATLQKLGPFTASLFMRYFGPRPLTQDDRVRSDAALLFNAQASWTVSDSLQLSADLFNLFNAESQDSAYYYASRLKGEAAPVNDLHFHPAEPRSLRIGLSLKL